MSQPNFVSVAGVIRDIAPFGTDCCTVMISVLHQNQITNLIVSPKTYVIDTVKFRKGMLVTGFYDASLPAVLIYPPQFQTIVIGVQEQDTIAFEYFDQNLMASNRSLQLNLAPTTEIVLSNGQKFFCALANHYLVVYYKTSTRSLPPQTTPRKVIVLC